MLNMETYGRMLARRGYNFYTGVPCSYLKGLFNHAQNTGPFVMSANEGDAVALCAGAYIGGLRPVVMMQNSGLTNALSPLSSLVNIFRIPILSFVSQRGEPGTGDQPQHELMGRITTDLLSLLEIPWEYLHQDTDEASRQLDRADNAQNEGRCFFLVVKKGTIPPVDLTTKDEGRIPVNVHRHASPRESPLPRRIDVLRAISELKSNDTIIIASTGKTGRELYAVEDSPHNLYMVGSMGCAGPLGLGVSIARPRLKVIVIDGDGALLMRSGSLAANARYCPGNMLHIVLDNHCHDSTGGQETLSGQVNFVELAASFGYPRAVSPGSIQEMIREIRQWKENPVLTMIHMRIQKGSMENLPRPKIQPFEVARRLRDFMAMSSD